MAGVQAESGLTTTRAPVIEQAQAEGRLYIHQPYELYSAENHDAWHRLFTRMGLEFNDAARAEVVAGTQGSSKNQSHSWRVSRHGGLSRTAFRPMDSRAMIWAWKDKISPSEAARIRVITGPVADRFYGDADW